MFWNNVLEMIVNVCVFYSFISRESEWKLVENDSKEMKMWNVNRMNTMSDRKEFANCQKWEKKRIIDCDRENIWMKEINCKLS